MDDSLNSTIQQPISLALADCRDKIVNIINSSNIPPCLLEMVIKDLHMEISNIANQQLQKDKEEYYNMLNKNNNKEPQE